MALDTACFTLHIHPRADNSGIVDLYDASEILAHHAASSLNPPTAAQLLAPPPPAAALVPLYSHHRALASPVYDVLLTDPRFGDAQLASCTAPSTAERTKTITLHNPETSVVLAKQGGTLSAFNQGEWRVQWEADLVLRWRREGGGLGRAGGASYTASVMRHPDPAISVGSYHPASKRAPALLEIQDHNFHRLEIADPRGLEIVLVQTALCLVDAEYDDEHRAPGANPYVSTLVTTAGTAAAGGRGGGSGGGGAAPDVSSAMGSGSSSSSSPGRAPPGGRPETGNPSASVPANLAPNELLITPHGTTASYVGAALSLLQPESAGGHGCSLIELKAAPGRADAAQKAVGVAAEVKARWYKLTSTARGTPNGELYQYVRTDEDQESKASTSAPADETPRRRINLNEPLNRPVVVAPLASDPHAGYKPPSTLSILLSKDRLPELEPKAKPSSPPLGSGSGGGSHAAWGMVGNRKSNISSGVSGRNQHAAAGATGTGTGTDVDGPRRPPKTMSVRRNGRWVPQPVPSHAHPHPPPPPPPCPPSLPTGPPGHGGGGAGSSGGAGGVLLSGGVMAAPLPGAGDFPASGSGSGSGSPPPPPPPPPLPGRLGAQAHHHGRRLLNKLGFGSGSGSGSAGGGGGPSS